MIKARPWNGKDLKGTWEVTLKIDGVRALWAPKGGWVSRAGKPLYNLPLPSQVAPYALDVEVYLGNFKDTIRATRTQAPKGNTCSKKGCNLRPDPISRCRSIGCKFKEATPIIRPEHLYSLDPLDSRLKFPVHGEVIGSVTRNTLENPSAHLIRRELARAVRGGYEGLVLRQGDTWLKVKPEETHDVQVIGCIEGVGKHKGRLGALQTSKGDVGTGFTDSEREDFWMWAIGDHEGTTGTPLIGSTIEVSCMHFTPDGKFRHPRFVRLRPDKIAEE